MMKNFVLTLNVLWITFFLASCGGGGDSDSGSNSVLAQEKTVGEIIVGDYFPLDKNSKWNYELIESDSQEGTTQSLMTASLEGEVNIKGQDVQKKRYFNSETGEVQYIEYAAKTTNAIQISYEDGTPTFDELRLPIRSGERFVQADQSKIDIGNDYDGDGINETVSLYFESVVSGLEDVKTPSGDYAKALKLKGQGTSTYRFSYSGQTVVVKSLSESWYVDGIGLVKNVNQSIYPDKTQTSTRSLISYKSGSRTNDVSIPVITRFTPTANSKQGARPMIEVQFSEHINRDSLNHANIQLLDQDSKPVLASIEYANQKLVLALQNNLKSGAYTLKILPNTVSDLVGNLLSSPFEFSFTVDGDAPSVISTSPSANAKMVPLNSEIIVEFNESLEAATVNNSSVFLYDGTDMMRQLPISVAVNDKKITIIPSISLERSKTYQILIYPTIKDTMGNSLMELYSFTFSSYIGIFSEPKNMTTGGWLEAVAVGDVNGDGLNDIATISGSNFDEATDYKLMIFFQKIGGGFAEKKIYNTKGKNDCRLSSLVVADINNDNKSELLIGEDKCGIEIFGYNQSNEIVSKGTLSGLDAYKIRVLDMNNDGRKDVVGIGTGTETVTVWQQNNNGSFQSLITQAFASGWGIKVGDINGDSRNDITLLRANPFEPAKSLGYVLQLSTNNFSNLNFLNTVGWLRGTDIGDINGDGLMDIVLADDEGVKFMIQTKTGFSVVRPNLSNQYGYNDVIAIKDINNDGRNDIVTLSFGGLFVVHRQLHNGGFAEGERYATNQNVGFNDQSMVSEDLNNDGFNDVVLIDRTEGVSVYYNNAIPTSFWKDKVEISKISNVMVNEKKTLSNLWHTSLGRLHSNIVKP